MRVLITGAGGQLGRELVRVAPAGTSIVALDRAGLDISDRAAVAAAIGRHRPDAVVNAAGWTAVDLAEEQPEAARAANATGPGNLAAACAATGARLVHVSSDYVFAGDTASPYGPADPPNPASVYGRTKLEGELAVLAAHPGALVVRSSWLYSGSGRNFATAILRQARERDELRVVADQVGSPTWVGSLARVLWRLAADPAPAGILHWADAGVASWYDLAVALVGEAAARGLLPRVVPVQPITTAAFAARATRPRFSVLDSAATRALLGLPAVHWRASLRGMFDLAGPGQAGQAGG